jgi:cellulose synthase/poly-beta-1,6-N-acetylglucosamine synthase-like glycosyltransferase
MQALRAIAAEHGFRVFCGDVDRAHGHRARATGGTIRDRLVRDALVMVSAGYVVCLDADTVTERPIGELVGEMVARQLDVASVRLVVSNCENTISRLQAHEYRMAMRMRLVLPWLVSGACHAARTEAHREIMSRHSLFFQGNDVEVGIIAQRLGYRTGHVLFDVPTEVPNRVRAWLRQRVAWSGGEFRLFIANPQLALWHPFFWLYGALIVIAAVPFRWISLEMPGMSLAVIAVVYLLLTLWVHRRELDGYVFLLLPYLALNSLVLTPIGLWSYVRMARRDSNWGRIRVPRPAR